MIFLISFFFERIAFIFKDECHLSCPLYWLHDIRGVKRVRTHWGEEMLQRNMQKTTYFTYDFNWLKIEHEYDCSIQASPF